MKKLILIITLLLTMDCFGQYHFDQAKISAETGRVVSKIKQINRLIGSAVYYAGTRPEQYDNFVLLKKKATSAELTELTNHPNAVVRCYAFWALSYDSSANLLPLVIQHIHDTAYVSTQFGCIGSSEKVGDFFINIATPRYVDLNSKKLTKAEFEYLDSVLIYTPNDLDSREAAISRAKPTEAFYAKAKELVLKEKNQAALVTLARYKKEQDIPLIVDHRNNNIYVYLAITEFPHPDFLPLLRKNLSATLGETHYDSEWRMLYKAIASYKNDTSYKLLQVPFTQVKHKNIRKYHIEFVFDAIREFYSPVYDPLLWDIWEHENLIDAESFQQLYNRDPERAFLLTKKTVEHLNDFPFSGTGPYDDIEDDDDEGDTGSHDKKVPVSLPDIMLDTILARDKSGAVELINKQLRDIDVLLFPVFANKALAIKDTSFVTSFFARLENEDNAHVYLKATEALIAWNDKDINQKILEVSKRNVSLHQDWGGEAFAELLKKNVIR